MSNIVQFSSSKKAWYTSSSGRIELEINLEHAEMCSHSGDCEHNVKRLLQYPYIKAQLKKLSNDVLKGELLEYGAWNDQELNNHADNQIRILWIACGDIMENANNYNIQD